MKYADKAAWDAAVAARGLTLRTEDDGVIFAVNEKDEELGIYCVVKDDEHLFEAVQAGECTPAEAEVERAKLPDVVKALLFDTTKEFWEHEMQ